MSTRYNGITCNSSAPTPHPEDAPGCLECGSGNAGKCEGYGCAGERDVYFCGDHGVLVRRTFDKISATFHLCLDCYQAERNALGNQLVVTEGRDLAAAMHLEFGEELPADLANAGADHLLEAA